MRYDEFAPPAALQPFVRCFWTLRGEGDPSRADRILPDGSFELVFHRGDPFTRDGVRQPHAMLVGEIRRPTIVASARQADVFGIRFRLGGFAAITGLPPRDLRDGIHDLREVLGDDDPEPIIERMMGRAGHALDRRLSAAISMIVSRHGGVRMRDVADEVGSTERTLERLFERHVGLRPKELARVARFQASLRGIDGGYYDDAHRIHEYQELAGTTPTVVFAERNEVTDAFVGNLQDDVGHTTR